MDRRVHCIVAPGVAVGYMTEVLGLCMLAAFGVMSSSVGHHYIHSCLEKKHQKTTSLYPYSRLKSPQLLLYKIADNRHVSIIFKYINII